MSFLVQKRLLATTIALLLVLAAAGSIVSALAQKTGGTLRVYQRENPPSASLLEEATISTVFPFSAVFNNLLIFDPQVRIESLGSVRPELAESWSFDDAKTALTLKLRRGVTFHDGKPFTSKDVVCTFDMINGAVEGMRKSPRRIWYQNVGKITADDDYQVTFHLKESQPSLPALLASNYAPIYPCHVSARDMRTQPIGTGPFKLAEYKRDGAIRLVRNPDYWKKDRPFLDAIDFRIITSRATRMLAFTAGEMDMTFVDDITIPLVKEVKASAPAAICEVVPSGIFVHLLVNRDAPPFNEAAIRTAMSLSFDRQTFNDILGDGKLPVGGVMTPLPDGPWGMPPEILAALPGYSPDVEKSRTEGRRLMEGLGYTKDKPLKLKISTRSLDVYKEPALILLDQLKQVNIEAELAIIDTNVWYNMLLKKDYSIALNLTGTALDEPDVTIVENYSCKSERNFTNYCNPEIEKLIAAQSREADARKRKTMVWEIERLLVENTVKPVIIHLSQATCWHPHVKGVTRHVSSMYNNWRFEDVWLDK